MLSAIVATLALTHENGECTSGGDPCQKTCTLNSQQYTFDLSGFAKSAAAGYLHAKDDEQRDYYWDACDVISAVKCTGSTVGSPVALQSWGGQPPTLPADSCAALGDASTRKCSLVTNYPRFQVVCAYSNGDGGRSLTVKYTCDGRYAQYASSSANGTSLDIEMAGPAACQHE